jgi:hypothetical protein
VAQGAVRFSVYINIQKWEVAFFFNFHCELYFFMESVEMVQEPWNIIVVSTLS